MKERLVYSSERTRVYERDQTMFDGRVKAFERVERIAAANVLPIQDGKIMLAYQKQPHKTDWYRGHIGGIIERGEDPIIGGKRELLEETGYEATRFEQYRQQEKKTTVSQNRYVFIAKDLKKVADQELDPGGEILECKRVTIETYIDMLVHRKCGAKARREEVMLMMIDGKIDEFIQYLHA